jgi:hypothetical protein
MHSQQNDKYTEMHGQQNDKYTDARSAKRQKLVLFQLLFIYFCTYLSFSLFLDFMYLYITVFLVRDDARVLCILLQVCLPVWHGKPRSFDVWNSGVFR